MAKKEGARFIDPLKWLGVNIELKEGEEQAVGDCPFCEKEKHLFVQAKTGLWDCKRCGESGNQYSFFTKWCQKLFAATTQKQFNDLTKLIPGTSAAAFQRYRWCIDQNGAWLCPGYSLEGNNVRTIYRYGTTTRKFYVNDGGKHVLLGAEDLVKSPPGNEVWVCEGHKDWIAWRGLLDAAQLKTVTCVAVPGAQVWNSEWSKLFLRRKVRVAYDNDESGDNGSLRSGEDLQKDAGELQYVSWPETKKIGYDLRDAILEGLSARETYDLVTKLLRKEHRRARPNPITFQKKGEAPARPAKLQDVLAAFSKWIKLTDDLRDAIIVSLAIATSAKLPDEPLWLFLVGAASSGKTTILSSFRHRKDMVEYQTSITSKSLISGWTNGKSDYSLLPQFDGKTAVINDGTVQLTQNRDERRELWGYLRDAYSGEVSKPFGHIGLRKYKSKFNMLIGITPAIHAENNSTMGERFLKLELREEIGDIEEKCLHAISTVSFELERDKELSESVDPFFDREITKENLPPIPMPIKKRIIALAQFVAMLRAQVEREGFGEREMLHRPVAESPPRLSRQFAKLAQTVSFIMGKQEVDLDAYRLVKRIGTDSCTSFHYDIVAAVMMGMKIPGKEEGLSSNEISAKTNLPTSLIHRCTQDLTMLKILSAISGVRRDGDTRKGNAPRLFRPTERILKLWEACKVSPSPMMRLVKPPADEDEPAIKRRLA